jgi:hypothetical protein
MPHTFQDYPAFCNPATGTCIPLAYQQIITLALCSSSPLRRVEGFTGKSAGFTDLSILLGGQPLLNEAGGDSFV